MADYLVDQKAAPEAVALYELLKTVGHSKYVMFGHQNDVFDKAGAKSSAFLESDTLDITGTIAGVVGIDALSLVGDEYSARRYNQSERGTDPLPLTAEGNVEAAARITNAAVEKGAIITLSAHMPNFASINEEYSYEEGEPSYARYNFHGYTPGLFTGNVMQEILPGGKCHKKYIAYLDMIADYAGRVKTAILFRPFHENTGSWFWWGEAHCTPEEYRKGYQYTVRYLRDEKQIHNFLYAYSPGSEPKTVEEFEIRYPGDDYVDLVGFDMYNRDPQGDNHEKWFKEFRQELAMLEAFGKKHDKLIAVTETGIANDPAPGDNQTALLAQGNGDLDWYTTLLELVSASEASYFLLWANFSRNNGFYFPYLDADRTTMSREEMEKVHEMMPDFLKFCEDERSLFAGDSCFMQ